MLFKPSPASNVHSLSQTTSKEKERTHCGLWSFTKYDEKKSDVTPGEQEAIQKIEGSITYLTAKGTAHTTEGATVDVRD